MPALVVVLMLIVAGTTQAAGTVAILTPGTFHGDEVPADAAGPWLALLPESGGASLHPVQVSVAAVHDHHVDSEGEETGKLVDLSPHVNPIALVRGWAPLRPGRVATALLHQSVDVGLGVDARLGDATYHLFVRCIDTPPVQDQRQEACTLNLRFESTEQTLFTYRTYFERDLRFWAAEHSPSVLWAGDLDGDGQLDVLLDTSDHYNVREMRLYLSSTADPSGLVSEAALFRAVGC